MVRLACCDKLSIKKGIWTEEEDAKILAYVSKHGTSNWTAVPKKAGLTRCGKSCRLRWTNYLRPNLRHESFTPQEEELIVRLHATIGSRWSIIAQQLPGRTDNDVKNYWNTKLKKKLSEMGIDPVTHKPFSQILADYGNIGGLPKAGMRIGIGGSLNKDLKNAMLMKSEPYSLPSQDLSNIDSYFMPTMVPTKMEPIQDIFFNNNQSSNQPFDLLTQLQTIKLVTEASNSTTNHESSLPPDFYSEGTLSSLVPSSSSSACSSALQEKSTPAFIWSDFLLEDAFIPTDHHAQEHVNMAEFSSKDILNQAQAAMPQDQVEGVAAMQKYNGSIGIYYNHYTLSSSEVQATSPCDSSFVEDMVARENEMFLELPELMEEPFYY